jgi:hypothetical protein
MTELPKSVRDELARAQLPRTSHPDADLLTAYGENSLGGVERQLVAEHVAVCAECREVLFLVHPEVDAAQAVTTVRPARRFGWLAWASVASVLVVVGSAVIVEHERVTTIEKPVVVATESSGQAPQRLQEDKTASSEDLKLPAKTRERDALVRATPNPRISAPLSENAKKAVIIEQKQKGDTFKDGGIVANEAVQSSQDVAAGGQAGSVAANTPDANTGNVLASRNVAPSAAPMQKARKAEIASDAAGAKSVLGYAQASPAQPFVGRAHWRISKAGTLERSYVADEWQPVLSDTGTNFRVVSVVGNLVWAGGDHGAIYVSRNGGAQWTPVKIDTNASVVSIHFSDEQNGAIQTSDGKTWKTSDAGNSWVLQ